MFDERDGVAIVGVGRSEIGRRLDRPLGLLALDAVTAAAEDAGLPLSELDGAATYPKYPVGGASQVRDGETHVSVSWMVANLGLRKVRWWAETQEGNVSTAIEQAAMALAHARCDYAVVWRALHMPKRGSYQQSAVATEPRGDFAYTAPYGLGGAPMHFAFAYMRYLKVYGARREHMAALVLAARRGANLNPHAHFRDTPLTFDQYMNARMIADPLCLFDCDIPVDGAGAVILARADRAADLRQPPAFVTGLGQSGFPVGAPASSIRAVGGPGEFEEARTTARTIGESLWKTSGLTPSEVQGAMLYDGFAPDVYFWLEGLGFCKEGEAYEFIQDGRIEIGGQLPVNTFGGNLSEGRLHGIGHWIEGVLQVQGRADARQIAGVENIVVATGLLNKGSGAVLSRSPRPA